MADYTDLTKVKLRLVDLQGDTSYDTFLSDQITSCSREIDKLTGSSFGLSTGITRQLDGLGTRRLILPKPGFQAVTQLRVKVGGEGGTWTIVSSSDYYLDPPGRPSGEPARWITLSSVSAVATRFPLGPRTAEVTGDEGWATVPTDIADIVLEAVIDKFRGRGGRSDQQPTGANGLDPAASSWTFSRHALSVLEFYGYKAPLFA